MFHTICENKKLIKISYDKKIESNYQVMQTINSVLLILEMLAYLLPCVCMFFCIGMYMCVCGLVGG